MKKTFTLLSLTITFCLALTFCQPKEEKVEIVAPAGMVVLDLSKYGKPFSIFIPDTVSEKLNVVEQSWGALEIKVGNGFHISITEDPGDITLLKSDITSNDVNIFKSYIINEPQTILWESAITGPEFHFYTIQKIAGSSYVFQDVVPTDGEPLGKAQIQKMLDSAKQIIEKTKPTA
ncbi:MAG: hypothetical protein ACK504_06855 [Bacteroidota bacterium]